MLQSVDRQWWNPIEIADRGCQRFEVGPQRIWVRRSGQDLAWTSAGQVQEREDGADPAADGSPEEAVDLEGLAWNRWATDRSELSVRVLPALPDRPLVVRSQQPLTIAARVSVRFYVGIPCVIRIELCGSQPVTLGEVPSMTLSNTWFGDPTEGELCLAVKSRARRALDEVEVEAHRLLCPVEIHNATDQPFVFERACVRVPHCAIHHGSGRLWASAVRIVYRGVDSSNLIEIENRPPREASADAVEIAAARQPGGMRGGLFSVVGLRGGWMSL